MCVCLCALVYIISHLLYLSHFSSWLSLKRRHCKQNRNGLLYVWVYAHHFEQMWVCVWTRIIHKCIIHGVWRCTWWSDKSVLLEVNSQEDGSVCCVFIGTMIHINNLASLPYSPFILFSSLPFDIPVCFHSQNRAHYVQRGSKKYTKSLRKLALYSKKQESKWCNNSTPTMYGQKHSGITYLRLHVRWYVCTQTLIHTQKESHTETATLDQVSR